MSISLQFWQGKITRRTAYLMVIILAKSVRAKQRRINASSKDFYSTGRFALTWILRNIVLCDPPLRVCGRIYSHCRTLEDTQKMNERVVKLQVEE
jgi:hypothetical protein